MLLTVLKELFVTAITKPHEIVDTFFCLSVSFFVFLSSKKGIP